MAERYHKVGQAFNDSFIYVNGALATVTGKTNGSFTKQISKSGVGNQSTTGVTVTEVDATNNAGEYAVSINGTTGFVAATGVYELVIFDTSAPTFRWAITIVVTSSGLPDGTLGSLSFTAVASNGRVTDGTNPVSGATVIVRDSTNVIYWQTTTDASGLWGPAFFAISAGTYTVYIQKSGYSGTSGTLVVGAASVTGPGIDLAMTSVAVSGTLTLGPLRAYARRQARDAVGSKSDTDLASAVNDALSMNAKARKWPWYQKEAIITLQAFYNTGTITLTAGSPTVVLATGTWPTWATSGRLYVGGQLLTILTRDSGTNLTLANNYQGATTGAGISYTLIQDEYDLPSDCQSFGAVIPGNTWVWGSAPVGYANLLQQRNNFSTSSRYPGVFAVHQNKLLIWPWAQNNVLMNVWYYYRPATVTNDSDSVDWDDDNLEILQRAIDYQVALRFSTCVAGTPDQCYQRWLLALPPAANNDKSSATRPSPLGTQPARRDPGSYQLPAS